MCESSNNPSLMESPLQNHSNSQREIVLLEIKYIRGKPSIIARTSHITVDLVQSQKTQGFCIVNVATLPDERRSRSKIVLLFNTEKGTLRSKI